MMYMLLIKKDADKTLIKLPKPTRKRITEKIMLLGADPDNPKLDIKPLVGQPYFRLRVGQWRVVFDRDDCLKIISIEKVKPRGGVYK